MDNPLNVANHPASTLVVMQARTGATKPTQVACCWLLLMLTTGTSMQVPQQQCEMLGFCLNVLCVLPVQMACWTRPVFRLMLVTTPETRGFVLWGVQRSRCSGGLCNRAVDVPGATRVRATRGWSASAP